MHLSIIVAVSENNVIGSLNQLPWRLPDDLKRFKVLSLGKPIIMGRKTFEAIGRPLPGRTNIVITRQSGLDMRGCIIVPSLDAAIAAAQPAEQIVIVGGAQIYAEALPRVTTIHLTRVHATVAGDTFFPPLAPEDWREVANEYRPADERHPYAFSFITLERIVR